MSDMLEAALQYGAACKRLVNCKLENANEQITAALFDEIKRLRAELAEAKRIDCRSCFWFGEISRSCLGPGGGKACGGPGIKYVSQPPVRLYEIDAAMAGGAK